jgi:hypothetical protein
VWRISLDDVSSSVEDCSLLVGAEVVDSSARTVSIVSRSVAQNFEFCGVVGHVYERQRRCKCKHGCARDEEWVRMSFINHDQKRMSGNGGKQMVEGGKIPFQVS